MVGKAKRREGSVLLKARVLIHKLGRVEDSD